MQLYVVSKDWSKRSSQIRQIQLLPDVLYVYLISI